MKMKKKYLIDSDGDAIPQRHASQNNMSIKTVYYYNKSVVKVNKARYANNAVPNCVSHMQFDQYQSNVAEVYDEDDGVLHAVITRSVKGEIRIVFKREVKEGM